MIVSSQIMLLGEGMVFAPYRTNDVIFVVRIFASSETHLQLLPSKLNIVGKELCEV